jgi:hypothetical protein
LGDFDPSKIVQIIENYKGNDNNMNIMIQLNVNINNNFNQRD